MNITKRDILVILFLTVLLLSIGFIGVKFGGVSTLLIISILSPLIVISIFLEIYRRTIHKIESLSSTQSDHQKDQRLQQNLDYRQIESLFSLFFTIKPELPLPGMRDWAASPDFLNELAKLILDKKPALIVEASSGVSTVIIGYCLKTLGKGKVFSLEHDSKYADMSRNLISFHNLDNFATVIHAPLITHKIKNEEWHWYDTDNLVIDRPIDLLIVDGPPYHTQELARYPALPILFDQLDSNGTILLDDGNREDEKMIVKRWEKEFNQIESKYINLEKGAYLISKNSR